MPKLAALCTIASAIGFYLSAHPLDEFADRPLHRSLGLLDRLRTRQQQKQPEESVEDQVEHAQRHAVRACHDRPELQSA